MPNDVYLWPNSVRTWLRGARNGGEGGWGGGRGVDEEGGGDKGDVDVTATEGNGEKANTPLKTRQKVHFPSRGSFSVSID